MFDRPETEQKQYQNLVGIQDDHVTQMQTSTAKTNKMGKKHINYEIKLC